MVLPATTRIYGPQLCLAGRWAHRGHEEGPGASVERGRVHDCWMWRAEWAYSLLPDDAARIEARQVLRETEVAMRDVTLTDVPMGFEETTPEGGSL